MKTTQVDLRALSRERALEALGPRLAAQVELPNRYLLSTKLAGQYLLYVVPRAANKE